MMQFTKIKVKGDSFSGMHGLYIELCQSQLYPVHKWLY